MKKRLVVGLGNPGKAYEKTRHNIGFRIVQACAATYGAEFHRALQIAGKLATARNENEELLFLLPLTYMNVSGESVKKCVKGFGLVPADCLVVVDDADLPFGKVRFREKGSAGGHHGLESIDVHLGMQPYARLKIGIGNPCPGDLAPHVLGSFTPEEEAEMPRIIDDAIAQVKQWVDKKLGEL